MSSFLNGKTGKCDQKLLIVLYWYINEEVCNGVLLNDLRKQSIMNAVKEEARAKYDSMLVAKMKPCSTTGKWVDEAGEWLVIYAG